MSGEAVRYVLGGRREQTLGLRGWRPRRPACLSSRARCTQRVSGGSGGHPCAPGTAPRGTGWAWDRLLRLQVNQHCSGGGVSWVGGGDLCPLSAPRRGGAGQGTAGISAGLPAPWHAPGSLLPGSSPGPAHSPRGGLCRLNGGAAARLLAGCEWAGRAVGFLFSRGIKPQL